MKDVRVQENRQTQEIPSCNPDGDISRNEEFMSELLILYTNM